MLSPSSTYRIYGELGGLRIGVKVTVTADDADANKSINKTRPKKPMTADPHNVQAMLVMAINEVLSILQADDEEFQEPTKVDVNQPKPSASDGKIINMESYRKTLLKSNEGKGD